MKKAKYEVVIDQVNYLGEVNSTDVIATFISEGWAKRFLEKCCEDREPDLKELFRFRIIEK